MTKSKGSAAAIRLNERRTGESSGESHETRLRPLVRPVGRPASGKAAGRHGTHTPSEAPASLDAPVDEEFEGETPSLGPASSPDLDLADEEFSLEPPPGEGGGGDVLVARKEPSDREIEQGGGDSMLARYFREMLDRGIFLAPSQFEAGFISTAHTPADIDRTAAAAAKVMKGLV